MRASWICRFMSFILTDCFLGNLIKLLSPTGEFLFQLLHFLILKFLFDFLYFLILSFVIFSFISRAFTITYWSICIIATLSDHFNIFVISVFACVDCLFLCKLRFSWLFICQIILDTIMDILNTTLWNTRFYVSPVEKVDIFVLAGNWSFSVQAVSSKMSFVN